MINLYSLVIHVCAAQIMLEDLETAMGNGKKSTAKLSQAVTQRWTSISKMLLRLLQKWPALVECYVRQGKNFPLQEKKKEVRCMMITH